MSGGVGVCSVGRVGAAETMGSHERAFLHNLRRRRRRRHRRSYFLLSLYLGYLYLNMCICIYVCVCDAILTYLCTPKDVPAASNNINNNNNRNNSQTSFTRVLFLTRTLFIIEADGARERGCVSVYVWAGRHL